MANLNLCQFIGRVGKIESRFTPDGNAVTSISLAVNESWKDKQGQKQERTEWIRCVLFGKIAEIANQYVSKGDPLFLMGKMKTRKWTDQSGQDKYTTEIVVDGFDGKMQMLGSGQSKPDQPARQAPQQAQADEEFDEDLPF